MAEGLRASGWEVEDVPVYTVLLDESEDMASLLDRIEGGSVDALVFPTPAHVQAFMVQLQGRCGEDDVLSLVLGAAGGGHGPRDQGMPGRVRGQGRPRSLQGRSRTYAGRAAP